MVWPPQSPDLNPIEQVWDFVKSRLEESDRVTVKTIWKELEKAWDMITPELIQRYIGTMADRCRAVIQAKGGHTRYFKKI
jgi:transposase